jgi:hypothetical protein
MPGFDVKRAFFEDGRWLRNEYECPCGCEWDDEWPCACDDDCPACGTTCSPTDSEDLTEVMVEAYGVPPLGLAPDVDPGVQGARRAEA